jgi:hypothetical protein
VTGLRRAAPLALVTVLALSPALVRVLLVPAAKTAPEAAAQLQLGWILAGAAIVWQLWLSAAAAAIRATPGLLAPVGAGARGLVRAIVPCAVAAVAIGFGFVALVVPGLVLLVLLAPTGASARLGEPLPAPLIDAVAIARARLRPAIAIVAVAIVGNLAIAYVVQRVTLTSWTPPSPAALHSARTCERVVAVVLVIWSAVVADLLAGLARGHVKEA